MNGKLKYVYLAGAVVLLGGFVYCLLRDNSKKSNPELGNMGMGMLFHEAKPASELEKEVLSDEEIAKIFRS